MMRGTEIISSIAWSSDLHPDTITELQEAILDLDRRAFGSNRTEVSAASAFARLEAFVRNCGSARQAAARLGIGPGFLSDIRNARRPMPDHVCRAIGLERRRIGERYLEI
ncbi:MAG: hypothetical protein ABI216_01880 [Devosia sp.]